VTDRGDYDAVAIIGMAGRFPGAADVNALWANLCNGVESVGPFNDDDLRAAGVDTSDPSFVNAGAQMDGIEEFDAGFFGMSRREAELTDPQHRVVLEAAWTALEHAGHDPLSFAGRIGLFGGVARNLYLRHNLQTQPGLLDRLGDYPVMLASEREYAITRCGYKLGLTGPVVNINTACSTSGVATHLAAQSLLAGDSDLALAGGACITVPLRAGYHYQEGHIYSADGHVRAFDAAASGTILGSGVAFVVLKRLGDALADRDTIYAVIRGSAINNDGMDRIGFTAPSVEGQANAIADALEVAEVDPASVSMVEAHGTGTLLGDPIEVEALTLAYRRFTDRRGYCAIGSLKSNIGHLDAAAGATSIIKAALSLYHERIPPSINYRSPNPQIDFDSSPFFVNTALRDWPRGDSPRRAGVSSFGLGGTNAHVVLEEPPEPPPGPRVQEPRPHLLILSAKTSEALEARRHLLAEHLEAEAGPDLGDVAHTLATGRARMACRAAIVAESATEATELLRRPAAHASVKRTSSATGSDVAFLFTGTGAQYLGMGASLYRTEPVFEAAMETCANLVGDIEGYDLVELLYGSHANRNAATNVLMQTAVGQPAIFALQYALSRLWASWGIEPAVMVGHSVGELAAACVGGLFTLEDALRLTTARGRLIGNLPTGAMTAILAEEESILPLLDDELSLAAVNAPTQCVASGAPEAVDRLEQRLSDVGIPYRRLPIDVAGHSPMMEPVLGILREHVEHTSRHDLRVPMVSTMTGAFTSTAEIGDPAYWGQHARRTVRFADAIGVLLEQRPDIVLVEIGSGATLASLARQHPAVSPQNAVIASLPPRATDTDDRIFAYRALAEAWAAGVDVDWAAVNGNHRRRIALPTYPFARERHWIEPDAERADSEAQSTGHLQESADARAEHGDRRTDPGPQRVTAEVTSILADLSGLEASVLDPSTSFTDLGFDSLFLAQFSSQARKALGVRVPLERLLTADSSIDTLAAFVEGELALASAQDGARDAGGSGPAPNQASDEAISIPLLPNVARYLIERETPHPEHWNVSGMLIPVERLDPELTGRVVTALVARNDALRLRVAGSGSEYASWIAPATKEESSFAYLDLTDLDDLERPPALEQRADELQASLSLEHGPLIRVGLFELGAIGQRLLVIAHHFVFDQLSWRPFWDEFTSLYKELSGGDRVALPPPDTSYEAWARALERHAETTVMRDRARLWRGLPWDRVRSIPLDHPEGINTNASAADLEIVFAPEETTALLRHTPGIVRKTDLIMEAVARTIADWTGSDTVLFDVLGHGRDDSISDRLHPIDSVGFFVSYTPLVLRLPTNGSRPAAASVADQIGPLMGSGLEFDLLRHMASDAKVRHEFQRLPRAEILFNHQGRLDEPDELPRGSAFLAARESTGQTHHPQALRYYPVAVSSKVQHGRLRVAFVYSTNLHERATIERLAEAFRMELANIIARAAE
jgi:non-ribosomal peptide synthase protein (TIGR01720 family)